MKKMSSLSFNMSDIMSGHHHHSHIDGDMDGSHNDTTEVLLTLLSQNKMLGGEISSLKLSTVGIRIQIIKLNINKVRLLI